MTRLLKCLVFSLVLPTYLPSIVLMTLYHLSLSGLV